MTPHLNHLLKCAIVFCCVLAHSPANGQIVPDATLPSNSVVTPDGSTIVINGGTEAGGNLFHSFERFDVPTGSEAFFNNALTIENILTRVTGGSISNIDGFIRANGSANLFLINPNGIIFGANARLAIGGSFIGSSASSIKFANGTSFSATNPQTAPLLTVSVPVGLQLGSNSGAIRVQGTGYSLTVLEPIFSPYIGAGSSLTGLRVQPEKTLALVGGDVALEGGILTAGQGRIELGSVGSGAVSLSPTFSGWTLGYEGVQSFQDIRLSQTALADASGLGGGDIQLVGRHVTLTDGSVALIQNQGFLPAGSISVNASESLELMGVAPNEIFSSALISENVGVGHGADIAISTPRLTLQNGGGITTRTLSAAQGGNVTVIAKESVQMAGFFSPFLRSNISAATFSSGRGGDVTVSTGQLAVLNGAYLSASTLGTGEGGDMRVNATDSVKLIGFEPSFFLPSNVSASTFNAGNAGNLTINTSSLVVRDGGRVDASTGASGDAGSVMINAKDSVHVSGTVPGSLNPSLVISSANIVNPAFQQLYRLPPVPSGASGDVTINTDRLSVTDGGLINVRNDGSSNAGTVRVNASSIVLNQLGGITAATAAGGGGNIFLQTQNLQALNGSAITATAGGSGNGGNITIDTDTLVALRNSDISANATQGFGGRVSINAQGIFGTQFRGLPTPESDITASSSLGADFSGVVELQTPNVDTSFELVALPDQVTDPTTQITTGCAVASGNEFVITGRGGLPQDPTTTLRGATIWSDLRPELHSSKALTGRGAGRLPRLVQHGSRKALENSQFPLVEATGWVKDTHGQVRLVAIAPNVTSQQPWQSTTPCNDL